MDRATELWYLVLRIYCCDFIYIPKDNNISTNKRHYEYFFSSIPFFKTFNQQISSLQKYKFLTINQKTNEIYITNTTYELTPIKFNIIKICRYTFLYPSKSSVELWRWMLSGKQQIICWIKFLSVCCRCHHVPVSQVFRQSQKSFCFCFPDHFAWFDQN